MRGRLSNNEILSWAAADELLAQVQSLPESQDIVTAVSCERVQLVQSAVTDRFNRLNKQTNADAHLVVLALNGTSAADKKLPPFTLLTPNIPHEYPPTTISWPYKNFFEAIHGLIGGEPRDRKLAGRIARYFCFKPTLGKSELPTNMFRATPSKGMSFLDPDLAQHEEELGLAIGHKTAKTIIDLAFRATETVTF